MPRQVITSRAALCAAVVRLVDEQGLDAVSIRGVAAAEGVAIGTVQHHFATKDELLGAAYAHLMETAAARMRRSTARTASPATRLRAVLEELLPLDATRRAEVRVALGFSMRSVHAASLAPVYAEGYRLLCALLEQTLADAVAAGEAAPDVQPAREAVALAALADGLAWHLVAAPTERRTEEALEALDAALARLLPGSTPAA